MNFESGRSIGQRDNTNTKDRENIGLRLFANLLVTFVLTAAFCSASSDTTAQDKSSRGDSKSQDSKEAIRLFDLANNAQDIKDFEFAAKNWEKLIAEHSGSSFVDHATYNCGFCYVELKKYRAAEEKFAKVIVLTESKKDSQFREPSFLYLGFVQRSLAESEDVDSQAWKEKHQKAIATYDTMLGEFQSGTYKDQALFFRGQALDAIEEFARAAENYKQVVDNFSQSSIYLESIYALGASLEQLKQFDQAAEQYQAFIDKAESANKKADSAGTAKKVDPNKILATRYRLAETVLKQGIAAQENKDTTAANGFFKNAIEKYELLYAASYQPDRCLFQKGFCQVQLGQQADAAKTLARLADEFPTSPLATDASIETARTAYNAGNYDEASKTFGQILAGGGKYASEAAHWQAQILLRQNKNSEAYTLATNVIGKIEKDDPYYPILLLDQADAIYQQPERIEDSIDMYLKIVDQFQDSKVAAQALYNAAFTAQKVKQFDKAQEYVARFEKEYRDDSFIADVLQVKADAFLQVGNYAESEKTFTALVEQHSTHKNSGVWRVRRALTMFFQKKYDALVKLMSEEVKLLEPESVRARGYYWIGAANFELKEFSQAAAAFKTSLELDSSGTRSAESSLMLSRSLFQVKETKKAIQAATDGLKKFGQFSLGDQFHYRLGEYYYEDGVFDKAAGHFASVLKDSKNAELLAHSTYNLAWSQIKLKQNEKAIASFDLLLDRYPDSQLSADALLGRGMTYRQIGELDKAISDLERYAAATKDEKLKFDALYEIGLAQVSNNDNASAVKTFSKLVDEASGENNADRYFYELAWAYRSENEVEKALDTFDDLATKFPNSDYAPEAFFHIAESHYADGRYEDAIEEYQKCVDNSKNSGHVEKAMYKIAFSHFRNEKFENARKVFLSQSEKFKDGELYSDALFMIGECFYNARENKEAVAAYRIAIPEITGDSTTGVRARLHASQAANLVDDFDSAIEFANQIIGRDKSDEFTVEAYLELGTAYKGKKDFANALKSLEKSAEQFGATGAQSRFLIGEVLFEQKDFEKATDSFKLVILGYGGQKSADDVKPWQAYSAYEAARCSHVRIAGESESNKRDQLIADAKKWYQYLINNFPEDRLVENAKKQLASLASR